MNEAPAINAIRDSHPRHLLVVGLPKGHYDKHSKTWVEWGFRVAT